MTSNLGVKIVARVGDAIERYEDQKPIVYEVTGLPQEDYCAICYAGWDDLQRDQWCLSWQKNGERVVSFDKTYGSTKGALRAVEELLNAGSSPAITDAV